MPGRKMFSQWPDDHHLGGQRTNDVEVEQLVLDPARSPVLPGCGHHAVQPPSTATVCPVTYAEPSPASQVTTPAKSCSVAIRPSGVSRGSGR